MYVFITTHNSTVMKTSNFKDSCTDLLVHVWLHDDDDDGAKRFGRGACSDHFIANLLLNVRCSEIFRNRSMFHEVVTKIGGFLFLGPPGICRQVAYYV